jgi:UDP-N-acetylmuramoylalanine--D-glutamate ligase
MGLGLLGRGIGDAAFLARYGAELIVTDLKPEKELAESLEALKDYPAITYHLGEHDNADFTDGDFVLKGAGVPFDSPYVAHARKYDIPVDMSASLFARMVDIPMLGVTGTRGKSTVTHLLNAILRADGRTTLLGGNVRGVSNLALLEEVTHEAVGVFELDSWQCQGFAEEHSLNAPGVAQGPHSPELAVFTTFMPDHLNYYHGDLDAYLADKANIFMHQTESDILVVGKQALEALKPYKKKMPGHVIVADESDVPIGWKVPMVGAHNLYNIGVAVAAARAFGVSDDVIKSAVQATGPLPGRLEFLRKIRGVSIYNDTNATTPDATVAALRALDPDKRKRVILIAGGADKGLDPTSLIEASEVHTKACVLLKGSGTDILLERSPKAQISIQADNLEEATGAACNIAEEGDIVLFSPGYASFGMFKNEYDRGEQFSNMVREAL